MQIKTALLIVAAVSSSVASAGFARVLNRCSFPVYLWSATPTGTNGAHTLGAGGGYYEEAYQLLPFGGVSIKISTYNDVFALYNGSALMQNQYTLAGNLVWYNLADTGGDPFLGHTVGLVPSIGEGLFWLNGQGPSRILNTDAANNLTLTLCA